MNENLNYQENSLIMKTFCAQYNSMVKKMELSQTPKPLLPSILIAEDDIFQSTFFEKVIQHQIGLLDLPERTIHKCQSGELAKIIANHEHKQKKLKVIFLDLQLSDMNGLDVLPDLPNDVPVIIITADKVDEGEIKGKYRNVYKVIKKGRELDLNDWREINRVL